jgi:hypothetical protein
VLWLLLLRRNAWFARTCLGLCVCVLGAAACCELMQPLPAVAAFVGICVVCTHLLGFAGMCAGCSCVLAVLLLLLVVLSGVHVCPALFMLLCATRCSYMWLLGCCWVACMHVTSVMLCRSMCSHVWCFVGLGRFGVLQLHEPVTSCMLPLQTHHVMFEFSPCVHTWGEFKQHMTFVQMQHAGYDRHMHTVVQGWEDATGCSKVCWLGFG